MKRVFLVVCLAGTMALLAGAAGAQVAPDIQKFPSCKYCGMDRQGFAHSRMLVEYDDGSSLGTCSIHCLAVELALSIDKTPKMLQVGDYNTRNLIDAEKAVWVIGGKKQGVMTDKAKWAFEKKPDAQAFIKENQGKMAGFEQAMKASYEEMYEDTKKIRARRAKKRAAQSALPECCQPR